MSLTPFDVACGWLCLISCCMLPGGPRHDARSPRVVPGVALGEDAPSHIPVIQATIVR